MTRRETISFAAAACFAQPLADPFEKWFLEILNGYLKNCLRSSDSFAVCDFEDGLVLPGAVATSGKTYDSVTRMLPAIAAWVASGRLPKAVTVDGRNIDLLHVLRDTFRNAMNPLHRDYWGASPDKQQQRQVEASIVAWALWLVADQVLPLLTSEERSNIQAWLASCTKVPVRSNNWAWFTAVNHAARLALSARWKEFSGDEKEMMADLSFLDTLAAPGDDGWYSDSKGEAVYDYYNFWVFASHFLYWNKMVGARYPDWAAKFSPRLKAFLQKAPNFFGANGSHVLFGRSLIYRWGVLTPLVLAAEQNLWPHSGGMLRRLVRKNMDALWAMGAYDSQRGKLRETLSPDGTRAVCESYIDNGHPYWGMQAFALFLIPKNASFWRDKERPLPVEQRSFRVRFEGLKMELRGYQKSGEVRWSHGVNGHHEASYRDKYTKLSYSSHFPFCIVTEKDRCAVDAALVFRDTSTGAMAGRAGIVKAELTSEGIDRVWWAVLGGRRIDVRSVILFQGEAERHRHEVNAAAGVEVIEGSFALGLRRGEVFEQEELNGGIVLRGEHVVSGRKVRGFQSVKVEEQEGTNIVHARVAIVTLSGIAPGGISVWESEFFARPRLMSH